MRDYIENAVAAPKECVSRGLRRRRWGRREQREMATAVLDELGISECADSQWDALSDWQRVLAELAQYDASSAVVVFEHPAALHKSFV